MHYYNKDIKEIYKDLNSNIDGISNSEALSLLKKHGKNELEEKKGKTFIQRFLNQFNDLMIIILIIVMLLTFFYAFFYSHDYADTIVIFVVIIINSIVGYIEEKKAEVTLQGLEKYSTSVCNTKRDGNLIVMDTILLVPGDIIELNAGDKVPADARIIEAYNLKVDESSLTGESVPVSKNNLKIDGEVLLQYQNNMLFYGTNITDGKALAIVTKTGMNTELGKVATSLNTPYEVKTPLEIKMKELSKKISILVFIIIIFVFLISMVKNYSIIETISLCIALAVGAIPEGLPAVITIALSIGVNNLAKRKTIVKQMNAVETIGSLDVICSDKTGTITQNKMTVKEVKIYNENMFNYILALNNEGLIDNDKYIGDPTETCLYDYLKTKNLNPITIRSENKRTGIIPFDSERKISSSINIINGKEYVLTKGSIDSILSKCKYIENNKTKLLKEQIEEIKKIEYDWANNALRVMGFAYKEANNTKEEDLIFVGMVGIIDPEREDVAFAIKKCYEAGIRPIMITGDSLQTASSIAIKIKMIKSKDEAILGSEIDKYSDDELKDVVNKYSVYARVSPIHKERIVKALQQNNKVVAMTGDGVNDAPAIKDAHIGIGMGITGTDVTKDVADVILLDDSFSTIVVGVEEGRRIFDNIRNNVVYSLSSNFAEIFTILVGLFTGNTILLPIQILFIDLVTDSIPSICLSFEKSDKNIMERKPRGIDKPIFTPFIMSCIMSSAIIESLFVLGTYFIIGNGLDQPSKITIALLAMVIQEILYSISARNLKTTIQKQGYLSNKAMNIGLIFIIIIELIVFLTPIGKLIHVSVLSTQLLIKVLIFNLIAFVMYEIGKKILVNLFKD